MAEDPIISLVVVEPPTPLKNDGVKVKWNSHVPQDVEKYGKIIKFHGSSHHQPVFVGLKSSPLTTSSSFYLP
jgi:hypothetical protein